MRGFLALRGYPGARHVVPAAGRPEVVPGVSRVSTRHGAPPVADASRALAKPPPRAPPPPPPVPPPSDAERAKFIDTTAMFVAKNGPAFEAMARERQRGDPKFSFLFGGPDEGYYRYKLGECRRELGAGTGAVTQWASVALGEARPKPLDADDRARMLGETPLPATMKGGGLARPLSAAPPRD